VSQISVQTMTALLTPPYARGGETLQLLLGPDAAGQTPVQPYDFSEYRVRYQSDPPLPRYVLNLNTSVPAALIPSGLQVEIDYTFAGANHSVLIDIPTSTIAGTSFAVPLPAAAGATLRLTALRQIPLPLPGAGAANFGLVALLGNIAKFCWVVGGEKDQIRGAILDVSSQRHVALAHDAGLDAIGADLGVRRFPPRPYSFDPAAIALYHLDDVVANGGAVVDETARFGLAGHPGVNLAAQSGVAAKFGNGFHFGAAGAVEIPDHADFAVPANQSFTIECFFRADAAQAADPSLLTGKGTLDAAGALTTPGWTLSLGSFRGFSKNLCFTLSDGANSVSLFADADLGDSQFHHVAGVLDRLSRRARLLIDGRVAAQADVTALGALTNAVPVRLGQSIATAQQFSGVLDEVRYSGVARTRFAPALGEDDDTYRKRLAIFRQWQVPDPVDLIALINRTVSINGDPSSFVLVERTKPSATANLLIRVIPAALSAGQSIAADGNMHATEHDVSGLPAADIAFLPVYLLRHDDPAIDYGNADANHLMQSVTAEALDNLLALLTAALVAGKLQITRSYDPTDPGLHSVGRALRLAHTGIALDQLGVFAHRAGFDYVLNSGDLYVSVAPGETLRIVIEPRPAAEIPPDGSNAFAGHTFAVHLAQNALPARGFFRWIVLPWGAGRASLQPHPADPAGLRTPVENRPRVQVSADAPGPVTLRVEYTRDRATISATFDLNFTVSALADGASITADGSTSTPESDAIGAPEATVNPIYLINSNLPIDFGADPNHHLMQAALEAPLGRLVAALGADAAALQVARAFDPADAGYFKLGRAVEITHPVLDPGVLGALAHQAQFDFVSRQGTNIHCSVAGGDLIQIAVAAGLSPIPRELTLGVPAALRARFSALPAAGSYNWSTARVGNGDGSFDFVLRPAITFTPKKTGMVELSLRYEEGDPTSTSPYRFEIRLNDALNVPATIIPKDQYDLLMNILNYFHPIGVEVITRNIREHVVEVRDNLLNAFPGFTYPDFRF
jgi:hypothetical protein